MRRECTVSSPLTRPSAKKSDGTEEFAATSSVDGCSNQLSGWLQCPAGDPVCHDPPALGHHMGFICRCLRLRGRCYRYVQRCVSAFDGTSCHVVVYCSAVYTTQYAPHSVHHTMYTTQCMHWSQQWQQQNSIQESSPFTTTEIRAALRTSRNDTSPGIDDIPNRVLKIPELEGEVTDMLNRHSKALNNENTIPDDWRKSVMVSISKKGNSTALDNQRGIANTCSSAKLFNKVLLSRLKPIIDSQLSQCQSGFRAGRSTTEQLMALRCVIDTCRVTYMTASLVFVDFQKAFDTLHRNSIQVILSQYNVSICLISDITQMYSDTSACVSTELGPTEWFKITSGVLQGDTLSPYLFIVLLDYALKKTLQDNAGFVVCKRNGRRHPTIHIGVLAYADDICLLAESIDDVECLLHRLETSAAKIGLTINYNKTKVMHLGQTSARHVRFANGDPVDSCDKFEYLRVPTSNAETVFRSRLSKAWAAATKLRSIFNSNANDY